MWQTLCRFLQQKEIWLMSRSFFGQAQQVACSSGACVNRPHPTSAFRTLSRKSLGSQVSWNRKLTFKALRGVMEPPDHKEVFARFSRSLEARLGHEPVARIRLISTSM